VKGDFLTRCIQQSQSCKLAVFDGRQAQSRCRLDHLVDTLVAALAPRGAGSKKQDKIDGEGDSEENRLLQQAAGRAHLHGRPRAVAHPPQSCGHKNFDHRGCYHAQNGS
jgi:hypothetical protein